MYNSSVLQLSQQLESAMDTSPLPSCAPVAHLFFAALATLQRRRAAGTLLAGCCRAEEVAYSRVMIKAAIARRGTVEVPELCDQLAPFLGYNTFLLEASFAVEMLWMIHLGLITATREQLRLCTVFIADATELLMEPRPFEQDMFLIAEGTLVKIVQEKLILAGSETNTCLLTYFCEDGARLLERWRQLQQSGVLLRRNIDEAIKCSTFYGKVQDRACSAAASAPELRSCTLESCGAREKHPAHFKACAACKAVVYCSKEHQAQDWPNHKVACKAARKAAAAMAEKKESASLTALLLHEHNGPQLLLPLSVFAVQ